jgi:catechol 2,3-dioxygenase-like lactoylglutathione lyase family enzyme
MVLGVAATQLPAAGAGGLLHPARRGATAPTPPTCLDEVYKGEGQGERKQMATVQVRYIVHDVDAAIPFYTEQLGFTLDMHPAPPFAMLSRGDLRLVLSAANPRGGGGQSMPDGRKPEPGGWNRFALEVSNLESTVARLRSAGARFRNDIVTGVGGRQILVEDPSGNPIELFEPAVPDARLDKSK